MPVVKSWERWKICICEQRGKRSPCDSTIDRVKYLYIRVGHPKSSDPLVRITGIEWVNFTENWNISFWIRESLKIPFQQAIVHW